MLAKNVLKKERKKRKEKSDELDKKVIEKRPSERVIFLKSV